MDLEDGDGLGRTAISRLRERCAGEVDLVEGGDLRGIAVHETARIMAAAGAGTVYTSGLTRVLAAASGLTFRSVGTQALKGFEAPVELFAVGEGS